MEKISILDIFEKEHITFETMPDYDYSDKIIQTFKNMTNISTNEGIKEYVQKNIGIKKYSFHQINFFIKLFLSQFTRFNRKFTFYDEGKNITKDCIDSYAKSTKYFTNGGFAKLLTGETPINEEERKDIKKILSKAYNNDLEEISFSEPLIFIKKVKDKDKVKYSYEEFYIPSKNNPKSKYNEYKESEDYLIKIKELFALPNQVDKDEEIDGVMYKSLSSIIKEKNNEYVITIDNFKKMILLIYRILADVPVIIMGDTGCGKTTLITKLNQLLNNGKKTLEIIDINPAISDEFLCKKLDLMNKISNEQMKNYGYFSMK